MAISAHQIPSLNGIRAFSVLLVMVAHAGLGHIVPGGLGVTIFFFLSGYLITTLLLAERDKHGCINLKQFYIRRFLRLTPPLLITLLIIYVVTYVGFNDGGISVAGTVSQLFYFTNYFHIFFQGPGDLPDGSAILWSLAVEEHFYLLYPVAFIVGLKTLPRQQFAYVLMATCLIVLSWRCILVFVYAVDEVRTYYSTDTRLDSIIYGCIFALRFNPIDIKGDNHQTWTKVDYLALALGLVGLLFSLLYRNEQFRQTLAYSVQGLSLMPLFYLAIYKYQSAVIKPLNWSVFERLGIYSYSLYLIHYFLLKAYEFNVAQTSMLGILGVMLMCVAYAWAIDQWVDKPIAALRRKFRR